MQTCNRCMLKQAESDEILKEIGYSTDKSLQSLLRQMRYGYGMRSLRERVSRHAKERSERRLKEYEETLKQYEEMLSHKVMDEILKGETTDELVGKISRDKIRQKLKQDITSLKYQPDGLSGEDLGGVLEEFIQQEYLDIEKGRIKITKKGARKLASRALAQILKNLSKEEAGGHSVEEMGYGSELSTFSRKYEIGDGYELVNIEETLLNALERNSSFEGRIYLKPEDFDVYEAIHQAKLCVGLIVDESGSMIGSKVNAAIESSLVLSELIRREPKDSLKVFLFSNQVREISWWDILNVSFNKGTTDIRAAMYAFRRAVRGEKGDKQAYLITDAEPNTENGKYIGFNKAIWGVLEEALRYRQEGITLNIIMLDQTTHLQEFANILAKKNAGRIFFAPPQNLGGVIIKDYLTVKKRKMKSYP